MLEIIVKFQQPCCNKHIHTQNPTEAIYIFLYIEYKHRLQLNGERNLRLSVNSVSKNYIDYSLNIFRQKELSQFWFSKALTYCLA